MSLIWNVTNKKWKASVEGFSNVVVAVHWICYKQVLDGEEESWFDVKGRTPLSLSNLNADTYVSYHDVTDAQLLEWAVANGLDKTAIEAEVEAGFSARFGV